MAGESEGQTAQTQSAEGALPFQGATREGLKIISKGGQEVTTPEINKPQGTASPEAELSVSTNAAPSGEKKDANTQAPENQGNAAPAGEATTQTTSTESTDAGATQQAEPDLLALLSDRSGGKITSREQAVALIDEVTNLRTQLAEKPKIEFPNEQAKQLHEFAQKFPGLQMSAAKNFLHVQSLDVNKLDAKDVQFEAFSLKKPNWTREQARQYFDEKYDKAYGAGQLETSSMSKLDHEEETSQARAELAKMQQDFAAATPSQQAGEQQTPQLTPDQQAQLQRQVEEVTKDFGGVKYQFVKNDPNSTVNVQMDKSSLQKFQSYMADPGEFLKDLYTECTENGVFSQVKYRDAMFELANRKAIRDQVFNQGSVYGELKIIKERKNTATPKPSTETPAAVQKPTSYKDALRTAVKGNGVKV